MKRLLDLALAAVGLVALSPLMAVIAIVIYCSSPGRIVIAQERVGRNEKIFKCFKFRTMTLDALQVGTHEALESWITPVGKKLRNLKLDELPQLYNVIRGDMSLVGPRPCLPTQDDVISARRQQGVFSIRPGITGLAQVTGVDMSTPVTLAEVDRIYLETQSLRGDLKIIVHTIFRIGGGTMVPPEGE
ncbi:O-antigen biosynthesis protein WbqP [Mesorhizobium sp. J18]|uniref:sugar transferase n=1 Tax=Mesorhizobium sp. J18 TaxID=935263 RepID=UPI00119A581E|nr:sugar transferase [Mesorhizobium sp. J18]TWG91600.1 O-antigen biosynthesis protein WbqP [Mesorhizobium sp. J18]